MTDNFDKSTEQLINTLSADLTHSQRPVWPLWLGLSCWLALALGGSVAAMAWWQPFRPALLSQWANTALFALESGLGFTSIILLSSACFHSATPGAERNSRIFAALGSLSLLAWLAIILSGFIEPVLPLSMAGKREHCHIEALFYSLPLSLMLGIVLYRRYSLQPAKTAITAAIVGALIPAVLMQLSCMYDVGHASRQHLLPILVTAVCTAPLLYLGIGRRLRRKAH